MDRIAALGKQYPHLASLQHDVRKEESADKVWGAFHYTHAMSWTPNPDRHPLTKGSARIKGFSKTDGVELNLYFLEGSWPGQATVPYPLLQIGEMNVVTFIEGAETPELPPCAATSAASSRTNNRCAPKNVEVTGGSVCCFSKWIRGRVGMSEKHSRKRGFFRDHSLSITSAAVLALWISLYRGSDPNTHIGSFFGNAIADWTGLLVMVLATKYMWREGQRRAGVRQGMLSTRYWSACAIIR